jgi:hypothetical protein
MVSELQLPRLPVGGWTDFQFQVWWQEVVTRVEESVNSLNVAVDTLLAAETAIGKLEASSSVVAATLGNVSRTMNELREQMMLVESLIGALQAAQKKQALGLENVELLTWLP